MTATAFKGGFKELEQILGQLELNWNAGTKREEYEGIPKGGTSSR